MLTPSEGGRRRSGEKGARVPRAMPPRRRRDGAAVRARTREQSPARVRVPSRQKAPWFFRRCRPSRGGTRGGPRPERRASRFIQTTRQIEPVTRVPGASREGHARHRHKSARFAFARAPRPVIRLVRASGARRSESRRERIAARRPTVWQRTGEANATGIGWCRRAAGRKLHSRARIGSSKGVPVRRNGCRSRRATTEVERSVIPAGNGMTWTAAQLSRDPKRTHEGAKASGAGNAAAKPWVS